MQDTGSENILTPGDYFLIMLFDCDIKKNGVTRINFRQTILISLLGVNIALLSGCTSGSGKDEQWPAGIQTILDNTIPLKYSRGNRLPLYLWPAIDPGSLSDEKAEKLVAEMDRRGLAVVSSWRMKDTAKVFAECLSLARAQKKLGLKVNVEATALMSSFFNGDQATAHVGDDGKPFFDTSFGEHKMGCPFTLDSRKEEIRKRFELFSDRYKKEGLTVDFIFTDWEIDGPLEVNRAFEASKKCRVCRSHLGDDFTFTDFQKQLRELRAFLQNYCYSKPVLERFPDVLVGNYAVYPDDGYRYWYDYFEYYDDGQPCIQEQNAKYRKWYNDFPLTGFTYAMPVVYPWSRIYNWYDFENSDYRWFYNMLKNASSAARSTPDKIPVISFVHWHTIAEGSTPDPAIKQLSSGSYQELLWHMLLRGTDGLFLWCMENENAEEIRLLDEVYADAQQYGRFLDKGIPINYDLPDKPGTVISGLLLGDSLLVRRTDFGSDHGPVTIMAGTASVRIPFNPGTCQVISLGK